MKPNSSSTESNNASPEKDTLYSDLRRHYDWGSQVTKRRTTGRGRIGSISFDEADEMFRSWIDESRWPYDAILFDPRIFTFIFEKTSRLLGNKLRGHLIPREGGDVLSAKVNNELLDFQWDQATHGGTMLSKWALMDLNTRKYGASFGLCKWRYEEDDKGKVVFDGPEMKVLNNRDCLPDPAATSIETCNWFQVREYVTLQDLENINDASHSGPIYENLQRLKDSLNSSQETGGDSRDVNWISRNRTISGLQDDPIGRDTVFKTIEIVTEYRKNRWITFSPKHGIILRDIPNPYNNYQIPVVMLRYYQIDDDLYGMSEIEPVKGLQKAINALLSQYVDEINQKLYSPVALGPGVREHTLHWGKGARWRMNNPMTDFRVVESRSNAAQFFNNTYSALVAAMQNALGESSLGVSNQNRYNPDKTATEVKSIMQQRNARDNFNQNFLAEALERQMMLWYTMNQVMLFADKKKNTYIIRIAGHDALQLFQARGLNVMTLDPKLAMELLPTDESNPDPITPMNEVPLDAQVPLHPVNTGTEEKPTYEPKLKLDESGNFGFLHVEPDDLNGTYDFVADVASMQLGGGDDEQAGRKQAVTSILSSPMILQLLAQDGVKPKFEDLFIAWLEDSGFKDADKFFEKIQQPPQGGQPGQPPQPGQGPMGGVPPQPGVPSAGPGQGAKLSQPEAASMGMPNMQAMLGQMGQQAGAPAPQSGGQIG